MAGAGGGRQMLKARMLVQRQPHVKAKREEAGNPLAYQLTYMVADSPIPGQKIRLPSKSKQEKDEADAKRKAAEQTKAKQQAAVSSSSSSVVVEGAGLQPPSGGSSSTTEGWSIVSQASELSLPSEGDLAADGEPPAYL